MLTCKCRNLRCAEDDTDELAYRFVDRDMFMRFRGGGVGHQSIRQVSQQLLQENAGEDESGRETSEEESGNDVEGDRHGRHLEGESDPESDPGGPADGPRGRSESQSRNSASTTRYDAVRFAASQASASTPAQMIER